MKRASFQELYEAVLAMLERRHPYLAAAVQRLGPPHLRTEIETAAIVSCDETVRLLVNPDFVAGLSLWELAGPGCRRWKNTSTASCQVTRTASSS